MHIRTAVVIKVELIHLWVGVVGDCAAQRGNWGRDVLAPVVLSQEELEGDRRPGVDQLLLAPRVVSVLCSHDLDDDRGHGELKLPSVDLHLLALAAGTVREQCDVSTRNHPE